MNAALTRDCTWLRRLGAVMAIAACGIIDGRAADLPQTLEFFTGDTRVLDVAVERVAVGNGQVISVTALPGDQLLLLAEKPGATTVSLWLRGGGHHRIGVRVSETDLPRVLEDVQDLLRGAPTISARVAGQRIVIEGSGARDADRRRAAAVAGLYPGLVLDFVGTVGWEDMIHMDVKMVELRRSAVRDLGIRWDTSANGPAAGVIADVASNSLFRVLPLPEPATDSIAGALPPGRIPARAYFGMTSAIHSRLSLLETRGEAQILAEPTLSCRSGGAARFVSGGEIPIPVVDGLGSTDVEYKEYGVILDVKPVADASGTIYAQIDTEVSQIDPSLRVLNVPAFLKRRSSTEVNLHEGETLVIAGLVDRSRSHDVQQLPGLGALPAIGGLFRSRQKRDQDSELVVLITPRIVRGRPNAGAAGPDPNAAALRRLEERLRARGHELEADGLQVLD
ncbi:MAG: pilus assembly protein N-terminal domain-containing protein [Gammaproteobacteria bacterium]|nr:pilus assembly protein N-terminal domain-containing protein [Gammaproteobacteria bacterium]